METPALDQLMGAYFHEDWDVEGSEWDVVGGFLADEPDLGAALPGEIERMLKQLPGEAEVEQLLDAMGCSYWAAPARGGYRGWLAEIAAHVREHLSHA